MSDPIQADSSTRDTAALTGNNSAGGNGIFGVSHGGAGVHGETVSDNGGVKARGFLGGIESIEGEAAGVYGESSNRGVFGHSDVGVGVFGHTNSGTAVFGQGPNGVGLISGVDPSFGEQVGVFGQSGGRGVLGHSDVGIGVFGHTNSGTAVSGQGPNGVGLISGVDPSFGEQVGVFGQSGRRGVLGLATGNNAVGVHGTATKGIGIFGDTTDGVGVEGQSNGGGLAGKFTGNVALSGALNVTNSEGLHLNAGGLRIHGTDILLDGRSAQISPGENFRALVDLGNKLVVNFQGDFGDGVLVESSMAVGGDISLSGAITASSDEGLHLNANALRIHGSDLLLDGRSAAAFPDQNFRALVDMTDKLVINFNGDFGQGVEVDSDLIVAGRVRSQGGDCAEQFDIATDAIDDPGIVMVIGADGVLEPCRAAYDPRVAGVVSGGGDLKAALILNEREGHRAAIALAGTVYCKVDASYGAVVAGDLLTTSPTPGHAMKATDRQRSFGAIIGKALRSLPEGSVLIPILVSSR